MGLEPFALGKREELSAVEAARGGEVDVLDASIGETQFGDCKPVGQSLVAAHGHLPIKHQAEPFIAVEIAALRLIGQVAICCRHAG